MSCSSPRLALHELGTCAQPLLFWQRIVVITSSIQPMQVSYFHLIAHTNLVLQRALSSSSGPFPHAWSLRGPHTQAQIHTLH